MRYLSVRSSIILTVSVLFLATAAPARADFIITGSSTTITPGGTGTVDFTITSNNVNGDKLGSFQIQLLASETFSPAPGDGLNLQFTTSQPTVYNQSNYVFSGNSGFKDSSTPFWGTPFTTNTANDTIVGGDFNDSGTGYTLILPGHTYLLARVQVDPSQANDVFSIALVPSSGTGTGQTFFQDDQGNNIAFSSTSATVTTASQTTTTPAPSSLVLAGIGSLSSLLWYWRSRRAARPRCRAVV
jgi:hypothetical protein